MTYSLPTNESCQELLCAIGSAMERSSIEQDSFEFDVADLLENSQGKDVLVIEGFDIPEMYSCSRVAVVQCIDETALIRVTIPNIHKPNPSNPSLIHQRIDSLAGLCRRTCKKLKKYGFWAFDSADGPISMDGQSAHIWCKHEGKLHHAKFEVSDFSLRYWGYKRLIFFWLTVPLWRIRLAAVFDRCFW